MLCFRSKLAFRSYRIGHFYHSSQFPLNKNPILPFSFLVNYPVSIKNVITVTILTNFSPFLSLSQHFQSVLQTLEEQVAGERQRLVETHLARVVATLNNNRRLALESYLSAVQSDPPQVCPSYRELP